MATTKWYNYAMLEHSNNKLTSVILYEMLRQQLIKFLFVTCIFRHIPA